MGELETQTETTRTEIATRLHDLADQLEAGGEVTLELGGTQVRLDPSDPVTFKLEGESDWSEGAAEAKQSIEFELVWWNAVSSGEEAALSVTEPSA